MCSRLGVGEADVVLCLGFMYHTLRYSELLAGIRATGARHVIIDTRVLPKSSRAAIKVRTDPVEIEKMAVEDDFSHRGKTLVGTPTIPAVKAMFATYGYDIISQLDWKAFLSRQKRTKSVGVLRLRLPGDIRCPAAAGRDGAQQRQARHEGSGASPARRCQEDGRLHAATEDGPLHSQEDRRLHSHEDAPLHSQEDAPAPQPRRRARSTANETARPTANETAGSTATKTAGSTART